MPATVSHLAFLHLPKTAGMTLRGLLVRNYRGQVHLNTELDRPTQDGWLLFLEQLDALSPEDRKKIRVVKGHMPFGVHEHFEEKVDYVTFLRRPIARILSLHAMFKRKGCFSADSYIDPAKPDWGWQEKNFGLALDNGQTRMLSGASLDLPFGACTREHLELAKQNIEQHFRFVGLVEKFDRSLMMMHRALGWRWRFYVSDNVSPSAIPASSLTPGVLARLQEQNQYDFELYDFAEKRFNAEVARLDPGLAMEERLFGLCNGAHQQMHRIRRGVKSKLGLNKRPCAQETGPLAGSASSKQD